MSDLASLEKSLGLSFQNRVLLEQALVHSSYSNENPYFPVGNNERLEFLGDAVLGVVIAEKLFHDFPELGEGEMTRGRATLVCRDALVRVARGIGLGEYLSLGKGEEASGGRTRPANLAGAMEAVIAAVMLDRGLAAAQQLILRLWEEEIARMKQPEIEADYKSRLQELLQSRQQGLPHYHLVSAEGPAHAKVFTVEVATRDAVLNTGTGTSKKAAEMEAARKALEGLS
ncbi:ribonuclease III [Chloroflexota bacterium]